MSHLTIYTDGAAKGNPGPAGIGFLLCSKSGKKIFEASRAIGRATNNVAEYKALLAALTEAGNRKADVILVKSDSELMVRQLEGKYKVKNPTIRSLFSEAQGLIRQFKSFSIHHIPREENYEADSLASGAAEQ